MVLLIDHKLLTWILSDVEQNNLLADWLQKNTQILFSTK